MESAIPATVEEIVREIERQFPQYSRVRDPAHADFLARTVERSITGFFEVLRSESGPSAELLDFFREVGVIETAEGLSQDVSQAAFRIGTGIALRRLSAASSGHPRVNARVVGATAERALDYLNTLAAAVAEGHRATRARTAAGLRERRDALLATLLAPDVPPGLLKERADDADWPVPERAAAVALRLPDATPWPRTALPPDVLVGLHLDRPCLIVPDPEGPGRSRALRHGLGGWRAVLGPPVPVTDVARSLAHACRALDLGDTGALPAAGFTAVADHLPLLIMLAEPLLTGHLVELVFRPLGDPSRLRGGPRRLVETFLAALDHGFVATEIAEALGVHPQTVRYRVRQIEELFGPGVHDPAQRLSYHMALRAWLALNP
ncbi:PucR family transcriptional regulator [Actinomadura atramentaria]|uniref:PucR family transcriptional regulator n=1 Tax=Actinomadura atramentaria TaxID=1990 RepID=UPI000381A8D7|nr:helix-turn-helix domain-containing protein [Actinomadura atramentaria]